jgi:hypothetical protein
VRHSGETGGSALDGQHPARETGSQARDVAPQLHPAVTGGGRGGEAGGEEGGEEKSYVERRDKR